MPEDSKVSAAKARRILFVANPGSGSEGSDEDSYTRPHPYSSAASSYLHTRQPPSSSPTQPPAPSKQPLSSYAPTPLTTNLPADTNHHYQRSNPALSSPSSSSSPAVESTPPPSTPGVINPPVDLAGGGLPKSEPAIAASGGESGNPSSRVGNMIDKVKSHFPHRSSNLPRRPPMSPTSSTHETFVSPTSQSIRPDKVTIMVTADSDNYAAVDITGARNAEFIRERMFTKLCVSDEDQPQYSIYRTEIDDFAIGDVLTDEQLFSICVEQGDSRGSLKFLVSHGSAPVHAAVSHSPTVNTIPPPVIPFQRTYPPPRPKRRSRSRHGSLSSASEQFPREVSAGYDASVSDDLDRMDRDNRSTIRPSAQQIAGSAPAQSHFPSSQNSRRPSAAQVRPMSPIPQSLRPQSPATAISPNNRGQGSDPQPFVGKYGASSVVQTPPPPPPPPPQSPSRATFSLHDGNITPLAPKGLHTKSASDAAAEREQSSQASESKFDYADRAWRHHQAKEERAPDWVRDSLPPRELPRRSRPKPETEEDRSDSWVFVTRESPRTNNNDRPPTPQDTNPRISPIATPQRPRDRNQNFSPSRYNQGSYIARPLVIPNATRNQPPPMPPGASDPRANNLPRLAGQVVPPMWPQKSVAPSSAQWKSRLSPKGMDKSKSMDNLKAATYNHPATLQPGRPRGNQLPMTRPPPGGNRTTGTYIPGDARRDLSNTSIPRIQQPYDVQRGHGSRPLPLVGSSPSTNDFRNSGLSPGVSSPSNDPYPRPFSAIGDNSAIQTHRYDRDPRSPTSYLNLDSSQDTKSPRSPRPPSPPRKSGGFGTLPSKPADRPEAFEKLETPPTPPLTPASPLGPGWVPNGSTESSSTPITTHRTRSGRGSIDETLESTLTQDKHGWILKMLDGHRDDATLIPAKRSSKPDLGKVLPQPPQMQPSTSLPSDASPMSPPNRHAGSDSDSDSGDDGGGTLWNTKPMIDKLSSSPRPKSILRGPPLTVQIENSTEVEPAQPPASSQLSQIHPSLPPATPQPTRPPPPPPVDAFRDADSRAGARGSTFTDMHDHTWAPRPAPEEVYDRLEEFFPNHDLDKPVIEASSGGTSPTVGGDYLNPPASTDKSRIKGKKSIRIVAQEHKKRIDRTSRAAADSSPLTNVMRKRSTKLWGSRLEEVTTAQAKGLAALPDSPSAGPKPIFKWVRGELIGKGTYGRVYLALNATTGEMIAVKQVEIPRTASDKNDSRQVSVVQALKSESETLKDLDHPNIVQYLGFEETPNFLSIFLEYVPGGSIGSCLLKYGKFDEEVTKSFTAQILDGLEYLHSRGILHRDLKADNILVETSGHCKITDFGISKRTDDNSAAFTAMQGTVFWMAPEVISTRKKGYNFKIDIWSVGCVVLEMWAGQRPWKDEEVVAVMFKLYEAKLPPPVPPDVTLSSLADDFRSQCFAINPEDRPSATRLRKHPYLILREGWTFNGFK